MKEFPAAILQIEVVTMGLITVDALVILVNINVIKRHS
jgi:hypothetical protein